MAKREQNQPKYALKQILKSKKYSVIEKDIIKGLCEDKEYTLEEIDKILDEFKKRKVE